jgi:hypothetical protein
MAERLNSPEPTPRPTRLVGRVYDLFRRVEADDLAKSKAKPKPDKSKGPSTPKAPGHPGGPYLHPATGKQLSHAELSAAASKFMAAGVAAKGGVGGRAKPGAQPAKPIQGSATGASGSFGGGGDRKPVQHPGSRGGKWYRTHNGEIRYGEAPSGHPHERLEGPPKPEDFKPGQEVAWKGPSGGDSGDIVKVGATGLLVARTGGGGSLHVPFEAVRQTRNEPAAGAAQKIGPESLTAGAIVQFEANGVLQHGKVRSWGKEGARVVAHDGEFDVPFGDLKGFGVHPDVAAEQPEVAAQGAAKAAGPAGAQEDAPVKPTKYTLEDFTPGQHVTGESAGPAPGAAVTYAGIVKDVQTKGGVKGLITVRLDAPTAQGVEQVALYPHEITAIDDADAPEKKSPISSGTSNEHGDNKKESEDASANKPQVGRNVHVEVHGHDYGGVVVTEVYADGFDGTYEMPGGKKGEGHFGYDEIVSKEAEEAKAQKTLKDIIVPSLKKPGNVEPTPHPSLTVNDKKPGLSPGALETVGAKPNPLKAGAFKVGPATTTSWEKLGAKEQAAKDKAENHDKIAAEMAEDQAFHAKTDTAWVKADVETDYAGVKTKITGATRKGLGVHPKSKASHKKFIITHLASGKSLGPIFATISAAKAAAEKLGDDLDWSIGEKELTENPAYANSVKLATQAPDKDPAFEAAHPRGPGGLFAKKGWTVDDANQVETSGGALYINAKGEHLKIGEDGMHWALWKPGAWVNRKWVGGAENLIAAFNAEKGGGNEKSPEDYLKDQPDVQAVPYHVAVAKKKKTQPKEMFDPANLKAGDSFLNTSGKVCSVDIVDSDGTLHGTNTDTGHNFTVEGDKVVENFDKGIWKPNPNADNAPKEFNPYAMEVGDSLVGGPSEKGTLTVTAVNGQSVTFLRGITGNIGESNAEGTKVAYGPTDIEGLVKNHGWTFKAAVPAPDGAETITPVEAETAPGAETPSPLFEAPKEIIPPGTQKVEEDFEGHKGLTKITVMPLVQQDLTLLAKPPDFMNWGGTGKPGPATLLEKNVANTEAAKKIYAAAMTGSTEAIAALEFPTITGSKTGEKGKEEQAFTGEGAAVNVMSHPSQHIKAYAKALIDQMSEQLHPVEQVFFKWSGDNPLGVASGISALTDVKTRQAHIAQGKTIARYLDLGYLPPMPTAIFTAIFGTKSKAAVEAATEKYFAAQSKAVAGKIPSYMLNAIQSLKSSSQNDSAWGGKTPEKIKQASAAVHKFGYYPGPDVQILRHISVHGAGIEQLKKSTGHILQEMGWSHTGQWSGNVELKIRCAPGVKVLFTGEGSGIFGGSHSSPSHTGEHETGMPADMRMWVQSVEETSGGLRLNVVALPHDLDSHAVEPGEAPPGYVAPAQQTAVAPPSQLGEPTASTTGYAVKKHLGMAQVKKQLPVGATFQSKVSGSVYRVTGYDGKHVVAETVTKGTVGLSKDVGLQSLFKYNSFKYKWNAGTFSKAGGHEMTPSGAAQVAKEEHVVYGTAPSKEHPTGTQVPGLEAYGLKVGDSYKSKATGNVYKVTGWTGDMLDTEFVEIGKKYGNKTTFKVGAATSHSLDTVSKKLTSGGFVKVEPKGEKQVLAEQGAAVNPLTAESGGAKTAGEHKSETPGQPKSEAPSGSGIQGLAELEKIGLKVGSRYKSDLTGATYEILKVLPETGHVKTVVVEPGKTKLKPGDKTNHVIFNLAKNHKAGKLHPVEKAA